MLKASAGSSRSTAPTLGARTTGLLEPASHLFDAASPESTHNCEPAGPSHLCILTLLLLWRQIYLAPGISAVAIHRGTVYFLGLPFHPHGHCFRAAVDGDHNDGAARSLESAPVRLS